jgi:hypothetical protein
MIELAAAEVESTPAHQTKLLHTDRRPETIHSAILRTMLAISINPNFTVLVNVCYLAWSK